VKKKLIGIQYTIPVEDPDPILEIHLDSRLFKSWYAWIFPHEKAIAVGCCSDPKITPPTKLRNNFNQWLEAKNIDYSGLRLETYPISFDYKGVRFGNIFLIGEAAGMASGLTGEGIYQSMVSGQEVARMIIDPDYIPAQLDKALRYNSIQHKIMDLFNWSHTIRNFLHELLLIAMNNHRVKGFIRSSFSPVKKK
jgi:geranylgeranyl reductase